MNVDSQLMSYPRRAHPSLTSVSETANSIEHPERDAPPEYKHIFNEPHPPKRKEPSMEHFLFRMSHWVSLEDSDDKGILHLKLSIALFLLTRAHTVFSDCHDDAKALLAEAEQDMFRLLTLEDSTICLDTLSVVGNVLRQKTKLFLSRHSGNQALAAFLIGAAKLNVYEMYTASLAAIQHRYEYTVAQEITSLLFVEQHDKLKDLSEGPEGSHYDM